MLNGEFDRRCCDEAHIDYVAPHRVKTSGGCAGEHGARGAGIPSHDDAVALPVSCPGAERGSPASHHFGSEIQTDQTSDSRHTHHQRVRHERKSNVGIRPYELPWRGWAAAGAVA